MSWRSIPKSIYSYSGRESGLANYELHKTREFLDE